MAHLGGNGLKISESSVTSDFDWASSSWAFGAGNHDETRLRACDIETFICAWITSFSFGVGPFATMVVSDRR